MCILYWFFVWNNKKCMIINCHHFFFWEIFSQKYQDTQHLLYLFSQVWKRNWERYLVWIISKFTLNHWHFSVSFEQKNWNKLLHYTNYLTFQLSKKCKGFLMADLIPHHFSNNQAIFFMETQHIWMIKEFFHYFLVTKMWSKSF